ncbi:sulfite exporter TauE/SafE family protein [Vibrio metschnikovii]|uniref:sulfite exporter TauE/SafE family protein n=1 Tax=Vibrio metschnikovii TaxID=28172 RepID=UPI001C2FD9A4|nr:sulfite exporter TauE/SafE family protein [Vibrio metschnikovii]
MNRTIVLDARGDEGGLGAANLLLLPAIQSKSLHCQVIRPLQYSAEDLLDPFVTVCGSADQTGSSSSTLVYVFDLYRNGQKDDRIKRHLNWLANKLLAPLTEEFPDYYPKQLLFVALDWHQALDNSQVAALARWRDMDARGYCSIAAEDELVFVQRDLDELDQPWKPFLAPSSLTFQLDNNLASQQCDATKNALNQALSETKVALESIKKRLITGNSQWLGVDYEIEDIKRLCHDFERQLDQAFNNDPLRFLFSASSRFNFRPSRWLASALYEKFAITGMLKKMGNGAKLLRLPANEASKEEVRLQLALLLATIHEIGKKDDVQQQLIGDLSSSVYKLTVGVARADLGRQLQGLNLLAERENSEVPTLAMELPKLASDSQLLITRPKAQVPDFTVPAYVSNEASEKTNWQNWRSEVEKTVKEAQSSIEKETKNILKNDDSESVENITLTRENQQQWLKELDKLGEKIRVKAGMLTNTYGTRVDQHWKVTLLEPMERRYFNWLKHVPSHQSAIITVAAAFFLVALVLLATYYLHDRYLWQSYISVVLVIGVMFLSLLTTHARHLRYARKKSRRMKSVLQTVLCSVDDEADRIQEQLRLKKDLLALRIRRDALNSALSEWKRRDTKQACKESDIKKRKENIKALLTLCGTSEQPSSNLSAHVQMLAGESVFSHFWQNTEGVKISFQGNAFVERTIAQGSWVPVNRVTFISDPIFSESEHV